MAVPVVYPKMGEVLAQELGNGVRSHATMDAMLTQWLKAQNFDTSRVAEAVTN